MPKINIEKLEKADTPFAQVIALGVILFTFCLILVGLKIYRTDSESVWQQPVQFELRSRDRFGQWLFIHKDLKIVVLVATGNPNTRRASVGIDGPRRVKVRADSRSGIISTQIDNVEPKKVYLVMPNQKSFSFPLSDTQYSQLIN